MCGEECKQSRSLRHCWQWRALMDLHGCAGLGIVYMVTGGSSMLRIWQLYGDNEATPFGLSAWILVFFGLQLFLSQVRYHWHR